MRSRLPAWLTLGLLALMPAATACAQTFDFNASREPVAQLDGRWRFHAGDDGDGKLGWAQPAFDDSQWELLDSRRSWYEQGHPGMSGWAWYRFQVQVPAGLGPLSIELPPFATGYQFFADGSLLGQCGRNPPQAFINDTELCTFPVTTVAGPRARTISMAMRVWHHPVWASYMPGGPQAGGVYLGSTRLITRRARLQAIRFSFANIDLSVDAILRFIIGLVVFWLYLLRRGEREYLWFALIQILGGTEDVLDFMHSAYRVVPTQLYDLFGAVISGGFWLAGLFFISTILRARRGWWFRLSAVLIVLSPLVIPLYWPGWIPVPVAGLVSSLMVLPSQVWILAVLAARARRRDPDAWLLLPPVLLVNGLYVLANVVMAASQFNLVPGLTDLFGMRFDIRPFPMGLYTLFNMAYSVALLCFLMRRMSISRNKEEQLEGQLDAARQVQQRLVPAQVPAIAGLSISAAYQPASQVGGDFYQVLTQHDGAALILVGDVSGKGLKAAMNGVLAIGALRALAAEQLKPGALLERLNDELAHSLDGSFITCLCVHLAPDGAATLANAGHLAPYRNGEEVAVEPGLPLGIVTGAEYAETHLTLGPGETLTLLSDGVVEARNATGELFGFERTRVISTQTADQIAKAAELFGQDDDITVLNVTRNSGSVEHA